MNQIDLDKNEQDSKTKNTVLISEPIKETKVKSVIDLNKDSKRKEIGFETESITDNEWKEIRVDFNKLLTNYAKLSKKNLTGKS